MVYRDESSFFSDLLREIVPALILFAFLGPIIYFLTAGFWIKQVRYCCLKRNLSKNVPTFLSLKQAQAIADLDSFSFAHRYAETLIPLFMASFYTTLFPLGALIAAAGAYFNHIMTVWQWLTIYRKPAPLSPRIAKNFVQFMILIPALMLIGGIVTIALLSDAWIHIPMFIFYTFLFSFIIYIIHRAIKYKVYNGTIYTKRLSRWLVKYFHIDPDFMDRKDSLDRSIAALKENAQRRVIDGFDAKNYWETRNDYVF